ncbi:hypothetical protein D3C83_174090 [compost metagenome]
MSPDQLGRLAVREVALGLGKLGFHVKEIVRSCPFIGIRMRADECVGGWYDDSDEQQLGVESPGKLARRLDRLGGEIRSVE